MLFFLSILHLTRRRQRLDVLPIYLGARDRVLHRSHHDDDGGSAPCATGELGSHVGSSGRGGLPRRSALSTSNISARSSGATKTAMSRAGGATRCRYDGFVMPSTEVYGFSICLFGIG